MCSSTLVAQATSANLPVHAWFNYLGIVCYTPGHKLWNGRFLWAVDDAMRSVAMQTFVTTETAFVPSTGTVIPLLAWFRQFRVIDSRRGGQVLSSCLALDAWVLASTFQTLVKVVTLERCLVAFSAIKLATYLLFVLYARCFRFLCVVLVL
jgi:hypothetical protein